MFSQILANIWRIGISDNKDFYSSWISRYELAVYYTIWGSTSFSSVQTAVLKWNMVWISEERKNNLLWSKSVSTSNKLISVPQMFDNLSSFYIFNNGKFQLLPKPFQQNSLNEFNTKTNILNVYAYAQLVNDCSNLDQWTLSRCAGGPQITICNDHTAVRTGLPKQAKPLQQSTSVSTSPRLWAEYLSFSTKLVVRTPLCLYGLFLKPMTGTGFLLSSVLMYWEDVCDIGSYPKVHRSTQSAVKRITSWRVLHNSADKNLWHPRNHHRWLRRLTNCHLVGALGVSRKRMAGVP